MTLEQQIVANQRLIEQFRDIKTRDASQQNNNRMAIAELEERNRLIRLEIENQKNIVRSQSVSISESEITFGKSNAFEDFPTDSNPSISENADIRQTVQTPPPNDNNLMRNLLLLGGAILFLG